MLTLLHNHRYQAVRFQLPHKFILQYVENTFALSLTCLRKETTKLRTNYAHFLPNNKD